MSYQYALRVAWLDDLRAERDPHAYDLCEHHVSRLNVPAGWTLEDRRAPRTVSASARLAG
jgi:hypothetical protein